MVKDLVSVIVTTKNSARTLNRLLRSIKNQNYTKKEIIVIDNASDDGTVKIGRKFTSKIFQKGPERSVQRNYGAKLAKGEYLFFLDSDMILTKNVVKDCIEIFKREKKDKIGGVIIPEYSFGKNFWAKTKAFERDINRGEIFFEAARFFPREVFNKFRGYDKNLTGPEDWDLSQRIARKYKISRVKSKILHDEGKLSLKTLSKKKFYYGLSVHKYIKKQKLSVFGPTTIYFLRPAFYRNWTKLVTHPLLTLGMFLMLVIEIIGGGLGYLVGRFGHED